MDPEGTGTPKSLLPIAGEPFAVRLTRQALEHGITDISVVVGYRPDLLRAAIEPVAPRARFVLNERYAEDVNIHSLCLALEADPSPCFVVEADIWMDDAVWDEMLAPEDADRSVWYTRGPFRQKLGGILKAGADRRMTDLQYVHAYEPRYADYHKLLGITKIGPNESIRFIELIRAARDRDLKQYWFKPWIYHLAELPSYARDVGAERAISVNTPEEYQAMKAQLER